MKGPAIVIKPYRKKLSHQSDKSAGVAIPLPVFIIARKNGCCQQSLQKTKQAPPSVLTLENTASGIKVYKDCLNLHVPAFESATENGFN